MLDRATRARRVFILGRDVALDVEPVACRIAETGDELVLLSLGYPVSASQTAAVEQALRLAESLTLWMDAVLVTDVRQLAELLRVGDDVTVLASGAERKRIERVLAGCPWREHADRSASRLAFVPAVSTSPGGTRRSRPGGELRPQMTPALIGAMGPHLAASPTPGPWDDRAEMAASPGSESIEALSGRDVPEQAVETTWTSEDAAAAKQASLRVYLGAAPGVGKTYAMLGEGQRRRARGTDVVVGMAETYGRPKTLEILQGLEVIPPRRLTYRAVTFDEMDTDAVIARKPEVALIDELAHTNIPGSRRGKRWEDVLDVLAAGIDVITTLNVQHLTSLNDVVAGITGIRQQETVPDWILDLADQVELVDMSPHALQRRMMHGNVYPDPRKAELALRRFFTMENLTALRELALMRVANQVDEELLERWSREDAPPETRERILVCVSRPDVSEALIRRGARIARRGGGDLLVVHVRGEGASGDAAWLEGIDRLVRDLGGEFQVLEADDPVDGVLSFAYQQHVTQILVGESSRSRWQELLRGSFVNRLIKQASNVDIHVISPREPRPSASP
jgi:nucleotide-binding universal stress UspA family protein